MVAPACTSNTAEAAPGAVGAKVTLKLQEELFATEAQLPAENANGADGENTGVIAAPE
jgi:hypothetical protein